MKRNMGTVDRIVRALIALVIIFLWANHFIADSLSPILLVVATVFIVTSLFAFCPIYYPFGFSTRSKKKAT